MNLRRFVGESVKVAACLHELGPGQPLEQTNVKSNRFVHFTLRAATLGHVLE